MKKSKIFSALEYKNSNTMKKTEGEKGGKAKNA
jgi:hypothetical protein